MLPSKMNEQKLLSNVENLTDAGVIHASLRKDGALLKFTRKNDFFLKTMLTIDFGAEVHGCDHRVECRQSPSVVHVVGQRCILS